MCDRLLYALTLEAQKRVKASPLPKDTPPCEVVSLFVWKIKWRILPVGEVHDQPPPWQAATGGTCHGQEYQGRSASAGA